MRTIIELAAILLGSLVIGGTVAWVTQAPWRKRETPPAPPTLYSYRLYFNGTWFSGNASTIYAASLALHDHRKQVQA